jgi:hypothetical protein
MRKAAQDFDFGAFDIHLQNVGTGQHAGGLGGLLNSLGTLFADVEKARLAAIVAAEIKQGMGRIADGEIVEFNPTGERDEISLEKREVLGERLVAMDMAARPAAARPNRKRSHIGADV